tara:strand:- start:22790 stop:23989 length:1200 start_codon:yes stop_codon:yes gene_type:complete
MSLLPLIDLSSLPDTQWLVEPPEPSGILIGAPNEVSGQQAIQRMADFIGDSIQAGELETPPDQDWLAQVEVPGIPHALLLFGAPRTEDDGLECSLEECPYLVGIETILPAIDPLTMYVNMVRLVAASAGEAMFAWDIVTNRIMTGQTLDNAFLGDGAEPPDRILWVIEGIETEEEDWILQTKGLHRCGRAELAVANVGEESHQAALMLLDGVASLSMEHPLPSPSDIARIGADLKMQLKTAESMELEEYLPSPTAMITDPEGKDASVILEALKQPTVAMYQTSRSSSRETRLARESWSIFVNTCRHVCGEIDCLVQVPFMPKEDDEQDTHHLWLKVVKVNNDMLQAELVHCPPDLPGMTPGDLHDIDSETISSWCVMLPQGPHGPDAAMALESMYPDDQ